MTAVVGAASRHRLRPIGAVSRGWDNATSNYVHMHGMDGVRSCHLTKGRPAISFFRMTEKDRPLAKPTIQVENDRVIVTEWRFPPGGHTGWHRHMHDYVVVPITSGELHIFDGKATVPAPLRSGVSYARQTGVEHDVINPNGFEFVFVEIELKAQ
jgi:mannose-6-phosphate isomerase-like protein (cupin superfamily)